MKNDRLTQTTLYIYSANFSKVQIKYFQMKTPFVTALLAAAVHGVVIDKSRSQYLAE